MVSPERLTSDVLGESRFGHEFRYHLAAGFIEYGDMVLDAACGAGYGAYIIAPPLSGVVYVGVDATIDPCVDVMRDSSLSSRFVEADLRFWEPLFPFDVAIGFETIEHLPDYTHYVELLKQARRWIIVSAPVVPTVGINPYHLHDFVPGDLARLFVDEEWQLFQTVQQPSEVSEVSVFQRR